MSEVTDASRIARERARSVRGYVPGGVVTDLRAEIAGIRSRPMSADAAQDACDLLAELRAVEAQDDRTAAETRQEVHRALGRLRRCETLELLVRRAPIELRRACNFSRAMISRVDGSSWVPLFPAPGVDRDADAMRERFGDDFVLPMQHMLLEAEMVRRHSPVLVEDATTDARVHEAFVQLAGARNYVGAPIMSGRRVVGFLHADRRDQDHAVAPADRDAVHVFARHLGLLLDRIAVAEELSRRHEDIAGRQRAMADELASLVNSELVLLPPVASDVWRPRVELAGDGEATPTPVALSAREREVLDLVASGATNEAIARELVVSVNTIKTHVARATRKLGVHSRAEAVAKILQSTEPNW